ncbi:MAG TPA: hypothetical protein ENK44_04885 [Caldithrix abyssi]|uniref:Tagaturonate/fructuronate epimerase n=1 Tax=Caldithrix abyssi TaxID=187145 RepID=A0A7V4TZD0_CALAY|nr:hypothetical protein [Caldithrix abyssi]
MRTLSKYSIGIGDRFAHQGIAQLKAVQKACEMGVLITPVWNKSFREHQVIGSDPFATRQEADDAVQRLNWQDDYFVDADHINLSNVDYFIDSSDFFTIDVADYIGKPAADADVRDFVEKHKKYVGNLQLPDLDTTLAISEQQIRTVAEKYLFAAQEAKKIYDRIASQKETVAFVIEVSMDETDEPQTPLELFFILAALASRNVPLQTIAPKFSGRFNKGVDYVGDLQQFRLEFEQDVAVLQLAVREFGLSDNLKLSIHSGSDKFSIYPIMREVIRTFDAGLHLKTAGTTWLEEIIGLAEAGGPALAIAKDIYRASLEKAEELCTPYASVIDIDTAKLPLIEEVNNWDSSAFVNALRHDINNPRYNPHFRQLLHVGYKVAAGMGRIYLSALRDNKKVIAKNVTENIFERHIKPLFI